MPEIKHFSQAPQILPSWSPGHDTKLLALPDGESAQLIAAPGVSSLVTPDEGSRASLTVQHYTREGWRIITMGDQLARDDSGQIQLERHRPIRTIGTTMLTAVDMIDTHGPVTSLNAERWLSDVILSRLISLSMRLDTQFGPDVQDPAWPVERDELVSFGQSRWGMRWREHVDARETLDSERYDELIINRAI